jgi:hypothetical protein
MPDWSSPQRLAALSAFYNASRENPNQIPDAEVIERVRATFWPTNCWSFVEASFAIIAPACLHWPHLSRQLIEFPIEAMIAGGLENFEDVIAQGVACATKLDPYVEPTDEGKIWLVQEWPKLGALARQVFNQKLAELSANNG